MNMNRHNQYIPFLNRVFLLLLAGLLVIQSGHAQETHGTWRGRITDSAGHSLYGATVTAVHTPTGTRYSTATGADGRYNLPDMQVGGPYHLEISSAGMETQTMDNLQVSLGEAQVLNVSLKEAVQQLTSVVVRADRSRSPRANVYGAGANISAAGIANMPTINRSITDMTKLVPQGSKDNSFVGSNFRYNNVTIDGAINNDAIGFSPSAGGITGTSNMPGSSTRTNPISMDAIQDMQVYLAPYDVKIGNFTGGSINAVTRSGTNTVEGSVYVYGRNALITGADRAGDGTKMPSAFSDQQIGGRVGFPIIKNKLFFFTSEEYTRRVDPVQQAAGSPDDQGILSARDAQNIRSTMISRYNFDPGTYGQFDAWSQSVKYFNRLDWTINGNNHFTIRNNTIFSSSLNLERDPTDFRFGGIAYQQTNNQTSTVAELTTRFSNTLSNSVIAGYATIHDYRDPSSDPAIPQVQIVGRTPGSTIFLGTDREASIFNMKQKTVEFTDNLTWNLGKHHLTLGTHNEFYKITYGFVNGWNGRVDYPNIDSFLNNSPIRVRGSYNFTDNSRSYILNHPGAVFNINFYSLYFQDEIQASDRLRVTMGLRADYTDVPHKQPISPQAKGSVQDTYFGSNYTYTPLNQITNNYFSRVQASPRIGFSYDVTEDKKLVLRGGGGLFTGRIPLAWLGYAFYNNGTTYGAYDQNTAAGTSQFAPGSDPLKYSKTQGIAPFAAQNGQVVNNALAGRTQVDAVDNRFVMPQVLRSSLALDYTDADGFHYTLEGIISQTVKDVKFQQINLQDNPSYFAYDSAANLRRQPGFPSGAVNPALTNVYEMSNSAQGTRYSITGQVSRKFTMGLEAMVAYTYGVARDASNGIRNSMESNWQLNQSLNPNNPSMAYSNFDIRHRIIASLTQRISWKNGWTSTISLFANLQSGAPFTYGFVNATSQNTPQQVSLAYIPYAGEAVNFFQPITDKSGAVTQTAASQATAFNAFIDQDSYLRSRRGRFTERNAARTPWNNDVDLHLAQNFPLFVKGQKRPHVVTFSWDILNLTNLLYKKWGWVYFSPDTYNSTSSVGLIPYIPARTSQGYPLYQFVNPGKPYAIDYFSSRWQMQFGLRYSF